jgi:DNA-directed RNA polymerase specialized sigma24 family protein
MPNTTLSLNKELETRVSDIHPIIYDLVPAMANSIFQQFKSYVEADDVRQECLIWAMSRTTYINEQLSVEDSNERKHNEQRIAWQMRRVAERYARKEKASKSGYHITDEAYYESATVAQLLPFVIASIIDGTVLEQAQEMIRDGQPKGSSSPAEGGNLLAMLFDIKKAFLKIDEKHRTILTYRYHENFTFAQMSMILQCAVSTADRRCNTAMRKLLNELGGESPFR